MKVQSDIAASCEFNKNIHNPSISFPNLEAWSFDLKLLQPSDLEVEVQSFSSMSLELQPLAQSFSS